MTQQPTNQNAMKWYLGMVAAFAVGAGASALMLGYYAPQTEDYKVAAMEPSAGEPAADGTVIAVVDGQKITMGDYNAYIKTMPEQIAAAPMDQVYSMVQDQLVVGSIISAKATGLESDPEVQKRLALMKDNVIRGAWLERAVTAKVTDTAMKAEYDKFVASYKPHEEINAQHILVDDAAKAKEIIAKLKGGAVFEDLVKEFSKDKGMKNDGNLGYFKQGDMVKDFADAAFAMKKGEVSKEPVKTQFGYHVIRVNDRRMSAAPSFEELKPQIQAKLQRETLDTVITELRGGAKIELFTSKGEPVKTATAQEPTQTEPAAGDSAQKTEENK